MEQKSRYQIDDASVYKINLCDKLVPMSDTLSKKEAIKFLQLDEKLFDNFFKNAAEIPCIPRAGNKGRFHFDKDQLLAWKQSFDWRGVSLPVDDYLKCLDFALAMHFRGYVASDWGTGRQREFGQKIANWTRGQLGELALKRFLEGKFYTSVELDFEIHSEIVAQDIISTKECGIIREPKTKIGIKASKPKSSYLVLGENEVTLAERRSDIYIFVRVDLPDDHLLRIAAEAISAKVASQPHFTKYKEAITPLTAIQCEIAGYCDITELERVTSIPGQDFDNGPRFVKQSGKLHKSKADWEELIKKI